MKDKITALSLIKFIKDIFNTEDFIPLHAPVFRGSESKYVQETIESNFVSSVGAFVSDFENVVANYTKAPRAVAVCSGTAALHTALVLSNVTRGDYVITQAITFVATCNAINYCGASPIFIDVDIDTMGLSPTAMEKWLSENAFIDSDGLCRNKEDERLIKACIPMHTFGHPVDMDGIIKVCKSWNLMILEDAAESLGSYYKNQHTGTIGHFGTLSFNGNKIITTGGGGMILSNVENGIKAKHITTTAKIDHQYEYFHDIVGYNYRMPNINAALGVAQMEGLENFLANKRELANSYKSFFENTGFTFIEEPKNCRSNYWLNAILCDDIDQRNELLSITNKSNVMTRPIWTMMTKLPMWENALSDDLSNSEWLEARVINIPSSVNFQ